MVYLIVCNVLWFVVSVLAYRKGYQRGLDRALDAWEDQINKSKSGK